MGSFFTRSSSLLALCVLGAIGSTHARAEEAPSGPAAEAPPLVSYEGSRRSTSWVTLPNGARAAVDRGITWRGVTAYVTLTYDLVGVDAESGKTLFAADIGAFWTTLTFAEVTLADGAKQWAIELRPSARQKMGASLRQYHGLRTGERLDVPAARAKDPGTPVELVQSLSGVRSHVAERFALLIGTAEGYEAVCARLFADDLSRPSSGTIDFARDVVLLVSFGNSSNCRGIVDRGAYESESEIVLRIDASTFQTMDGWQKARPWGLFVLPRREDKVYVVQDDAQRLIGGPPLWVERWRFASVPTPDQELAGLPAATDTDWYGWAQAEERGSRPAPPPPKAPPR